MTGTSLKSLLPNSVATQVLTGSVTGRSFLILVRHRRNLLRLIALMMQFLIPWTEVQQKEHKEAEICPSELARIQKRAAMTTVQD